jgi:hypothetical protein
MYVGCQCGKRAHSRDLSTADKGVDYVLQHHITLNFHSLRPRLLFNQSAGHLSGFIGNDILPEVVVHVWRKEHSLDDAHPANEQASTIPVDVKVVILAAYNGVPDPGPSILITPSHEKVDVESREYMQIHDQNVISSSNPTLTA